MIRDTAVPFGMAGHPNAAPIPQGPAMQGMQVAPAGYKAPQPNFNLPRPNLSNYPQWALDSMRQRQNPLQAGLARPTMPPAGAQPVQGMPRPGMTPPTGMNPQYQQALVSSLRNNGQ